MGSSPLSHHEAPWFVIIVLAHCEAPLGFCFFYVSFAQLPSPIHQNFPLHLVGDGGGIRVSAAAELSALTEHLENSSPLSLETANSLLCGASFSQRQEKEASIEMDDQRPRGVHAHLTVATLPCLMTFPV